MDDRITDNARRETLIMTMSPGFDLPHHTTVLASIGMTHINQVAQMTASQIDDLTGGSSNEFASLVIALKDHGLSFIQEFQPSQVLDFTDPVSLLMLPPRAANGLKRGGISTINDLLNAHPLELLSIKSFGIQSLKDVYLCLGKVHVHDLSSLPDRTDHFGKLPEWNIAKTTVVAEDSPAPDLSLTQRIEILSSSLRPIEHDVLTQRSRITGMLTLQELAKKHALSRERIRQIEVRIANHFADDAHVLSTIETLASCAPLIELDEFVMRGFEINDLSKMIHFFAQKLNLLPARSDLSVIALHGIEFVHIGNSESLATISELNSVDKIMADKMNLRRGNIADLQVELSDYLRHDYPHTRNLRDETIDIICNGMLTNSSIWRLGENYIWTGGAKYETLKSRIFLEGQPLSLTQLESFYDEVFPGDETNQRRVTTFLFNKHYGFVRTSEDTWSHRDLGATALGTVVDRMRSLLEENNGTMPLSQLISTLQNTDQSVKASTVTTYAHSGILFDIEDGLVLLRPSTVVITPAYARGMFRVLDASHYGSWSWQCIRDDNLLYKSSLRIPDALHSLLASSPSSLDDTIDFGDLGKARIRSSGTSRYFVTRLGFRDVLDRAKIADGARFRIVVTGKGKAVVEPMAQIDYEDDISLLSSTVGLSNQSLNLTDACLLAVGLDPTSQNTATEIKRRVASRGSNFAEAFFTLNPWLRTKA